MQLQSESIKEITKALSKAQFEMKAAKKSKTNPFFKSKYADLESVIEAVKEPFYNNGLAFNQATLPHDNGQFLVVTTISHISGEWIRGYLPIKPTKNDPQALGSAVTYGKRYGLQALSGQPSEDDDGNEASKAQPKKNLDTELKELDQFISGWGIKDKQMQIGIKNYYLQSCGIKSFGSDDIKDMKEKFDAVYQGYMSQAGANG